MNKRGWLRVFEAVLSILLVTSVVLLLYSQQKVGDSSTTISDFGDKVLEDISFNFSLRSAVFSDDNESLAKFISGQFPANIGFEVRICELNVLEYCTLSQVIQSDVFVSEKIFASNITDYNPKRVKLFLWQK